MRRATDAFAVLIALAGFAVSYATQADLAGQHGFSGWEAWCWPGIADAAALGMVVRLHFGQVRPGWYTAEAWAVFGIASAVAVAANAVADRYDPLGGAMHGVVPIVVLLVAHVIVHGRPAEVGAPAPMPAVEEATDEHAEERASVHEGTRNQRVRARPRARGRTASRARLEAMLRNAAARGQALDAGTVAKRLGVTNGHARRLLAEARQPRVVEAGEATP